jgi:hypothetical protein
MVGPSDTGYKVPSSFETSKTTAPSTQCHVLNYVAVETSNLVPTECLFDAFLTVKDAHLAGHGPVGKVTT